MIELARWFAKQPKHATRHFVSDFRGRRTGLLGTSWYVNHPLLPLRDDVAMINMDMIGRMREARCFIDRRGHRHDVAKLI